MVRAGAAFEPVLALGEGEGRGRARDGEDVGAGGADWGSVGGLVGGVLLVGWEGKGGEEGEGGGQRSISVVGGWCAEFQSVECGVWVFGAEWCAEFGPFSCDNFSAALQSCLSLYMSRRSYHAYMN